MSVLLFAVLLGVAMLVIDGGNLMLQRRNLQGVADASAMAGLKELPASTSSAITVATDYAGEKFNSGDGATIDELVVTGDNSSSCDGGMGLVELQPYSVCVVVRKNETGFLTKLIGVTSSTVKARSIARLSQVTALGAYLPFGVKTTGYTFGSQLNVKPQDTISDGGMINAPNDTTCTVNGGNGVKDVIASLSFGGTDACPIVVGQNINTQTGVAVGPITHGFDERIGSNLDSITDVFGTDPNGNPYVKLPNSPRLGIMPIGVDSANPASGLWPLQSNASITVVGYILVYIGKQGSSPYPPYTGNGNSIEVWLTPMNAPIPDNMNSVDGNYSSTNPSPIEYTLVG